MELASNADRGRALSPFSGTLTPDPAHPNAPTHTGRPRPVLENLLDHDCL